MQLVELRPLKPFVGSYRCSLSEADVIDTELVEKEGGLVVKEKVPRKRYRGFIPIDRKITSAENELARKGQLPGNLQLLENGYVREFPKGEQTVKVPQEVAENLIERGLAERVDPLPVATTRKMKLSPHTA